MKEQYIDLNSEIYSTSGDAVYKEVIARAKSFIPKGKQNEVANKIGLAPSALSACLREESPTVMRSVPFCSLICLLGGEIFYHGEDTPTPPSTNNDLKELVKAQQKTIEQQARLIDILLEKECLKKAEE